MKVLPIIDAYAFRYKVQLGGSSFVLRFTWVERANSWYMDVGLEDGTWLRTGVRIVVGFPLFRNSVDDRLPTGVFWAYTPDGREIEKREDLGGRVKLLFIHVDELPSPPPKASVKVLVT